jgi:hypothetical protein
VILALDADPLLTDPEMIRHARGFADGRRAGVRAPPFDRLRAEMNRLYAVEGVHSLTARWPIIAFVSRAGRSRRSWPRWRHGCPRRRQGPRQPAFRRRSAVDRGGRQGSPGESRQGLIVAGERQPAAVTAVCALNAHLGNTGKTVTTTRRKTRRCRA